MNFNFYLKIMETIVFLKQVFQNTKMIQSYFHFSLN